jgi:hypothetical protein
VSAPIPRFNFWKVITTDDPAEQWLTKRELAEHLSVSVRSIEYAMADGMPHAIIFGRPRFRRSEVEPWLERTGRLTRGTR